MEGIGDSFAFLAGVPAVVVLTLSAATILLTSDWRLALSALLLQYLFLGLTLTRFIQPEVAFVRILTGALVVPILYLTARQVGDVGHAGEVEGAEGRFLGLPMGWGAGPLGLPLRLLTVLLTALALIQFYPLSATLPPAVSATGLGVPPDVSFVALWLVTMGLMGIVLSGKVLRVAPAVLTVLCGFDLVYAGLEQHLAIAGFFAALTLLAALAFSYLAAVQGLAPGASPVDEEEAAK
jgi:hypothetical protein